MWLIRKLRFSLAAIMMLVLTAAAASALFVKCRERLAARSQIAWRFDAPSLLLLGIGLTALALGSLKKHSAVQILLQITLACIGLLTFIWLAEAQFERGLRYWFQATFAVLVALPLLARRIIKTELPRGPRRDWWKRTCEAFFFAWLTVVLVSAGALYQIVLYEALGEFLLPL